MLSHLGIAIATFAVTNVDDLLILSLYFASPRFRIKSIVFGQYVGIFAIVLVSFLGILLGGILQNHWISLLGILPLAIGVKDLFSMRRNDDESKEVNPDIKVKFQFLNVALVTFANGGDNIGIYAPLFANIDFNYVYIYLIVFIMLTAVWCLIGYYFVKHSKVKALFSKYGKIVLPFFLIGLGLFIMKEFLIWLF